jgi:predicted P-loop ATPase
MRSWASKLQLVEKREERMLDFEGLNTLLVSRFHDFVPDWLPAGKIDLISLYAKVFETTQGGAYKQLSKKANFTVTSRAPESKQITHLKPPPPGSRPPEMFHPRHGLPSQGWCYKNINGEKLFYQARYETEEGKVFCPWSWDGEKWVMKAPPAPRSLFQLERLKDFTGPVMVVEGEKAARAAQKIVGGWYTVVSWLNGSSSVKKNDWSVLKGKDVLLWPDADKAGIKAMETLCQILDGHVKSIKILDVSDCKDGWDAADALEDGWEWETLLEWARPRAKKYEKPIVELESLIEKTPEPVIEPELEHEPEVPAYVEEAPPPEFEDDVDASLFATYEQAGIQCNTKGKPYLNLLNTVRALEYFPQLKGRLWFDSFLRKRRTNMEPYWREDKKKIAPRDWTDNDYSKIQQVLQGAFGFHNINSNIVEQAVKSYCEDNTRNELTDYLDSCEWDGDHRIETFFIDFFGAPDNEYARAVGRNFFTAIAARSYKPGCKMDNMVILEGAQGVGKSEAIKALAGEWFTENNTKIDSKDFHMSLAGILIMEFAELDYFRKTDVDTLKKTITTRHDNYRGVYGKEFHKYPRTTIFVGTTNNDEYLTDVTGSRRFWPIDVTVNSVDVEKIKQIKDQLFAEGKELYKSGANWWEVPQDILNERHQKSMPQDARTQDVNEWVYRNQITRIKLIDLLNAFQVNKGLPNYNQVARQYRDLLQRAGYTRSQRRYNHGYYWYPPKEVLEPKEEYDNVEFLVE